uniref:O-antigen polymerase n=1 Tax=uncultured Flavobacteriia bacterium TaxID=212695 RepID=H6REP2_9BACT|nr:O-antigen polymerase [uncultured Flavobacteriia bacterium]
MAKSAPKQTSLDTSNFLPSLLIIGLLLVGFVPNIEAVDKIAPQWLYLSILNLLCGLFLFFNRKSFKERLVAVLTSYMSLTYMLFVLWAALSYFYAINPTEVLVNIVRHFNTLFMFLHLGILFYNLKDKNRLLSLAIMAILTIEVYAVLEQAMEMYKAGGIQSGNLKGVTANRNITAFSIAIKIPYVLYLIIRTPKLWIKIVYAFLILMSLFSLSMIQSRASFVAAMLIGVLLLAWTLKNYFTSRIPKDLVPNLYYVIPFILAVVLNQALIADKGADAMARVATIKLNTEEGSINQRLRYYEDVLTHITDSPFLGVGIGNWKLKSIDYDKNDIDGYIVPYHAHSDFIQLGAELGFLGFFLYFGIFLFAAYFGFVILFKSDMDSDNKWFVFLMITALGVYFVDANLNFPIARPQVLAPWALTMALISYYYHQVISKKKQPKNISALTFFPLLGVLLMVPSISITNTTYKSLKGQLFLLRDFNNNQFSVTMDKIDNITPDLPNITVTTIPMKSIKARYYFNAKKYDKALALLNEGISANPYLFFSENLKAQIFLKQGKIDSAHVNARKAFYGLSKNALHASTYAQTLQIRGDSKEAVKVFDVLSRKSGPVIWRNFLIVLSQMLPTGDLDFVKYTTKGVELFPDDKQIFSLKKLAVVGQQKVKEAAAISQLGLQNFNQKKYVEAGLEFEKALKIDQLEYAHFENAASAFFMAGDYDKALIYSDLVINQLNPKTGKSEYINALVHLNIGGVPKACELLQQAIDYGYNQAQSTLDQRCK